MPVNRDLLGILACPRCKGEVVLNGRGDGIECSACRVTYPVRDDIPVMLVDEALPWPEEKP